jgi:hypothetical protein
VRIAVAARWLVCTAALVAVPPPALCEESDAGSGHSRPRDAAQAVQEGSVTQWLEHYRRERGEEWTRSKPPAPQVSAPSGSPQPAAPDAAQEHPRTPRE